MPTKIAIAAGGVVAAFAVLLWRRRRMVAVGVVIAFLAITTAWFIPDGFEQTLRNGHSVCCGHVIDRNPLRMVVAIAGTIAALVLVVTGSFRQFVPRRPKQAPASQT
jgi:hypothetical protein